MAKIPLRAYVSEIENFIERGEIEQAIAHAKNILKTYPKHIETYRLLGKAFLESQRYTQALDILQRVLSVIPDDFISQIGMSIIREDEGNLDQAIWHMERAYEVQPFNPAVQDELRRLYGRRDGVQPPKIRLTRGALVRMYARGELYPQAIAETRAALAEDPQRVDLEVLLARLYYLSKQKIEAIEACSRLLKRLPYCKEAIEILTRVLQETNRAGDAPYYLQRLYTLDPYAAFISPNAQTSEQVPEQAVMVERFNLDTSMAEVQTPEWTQNVGIQWEEQEAEDLPDWLNTLKPAQETGTGALMFGTPEPTAPAEEPNLPPAQQFAASPADELMPDFLRDAGWTQSDRRADDIMREQLSASGEEESAAAPAEIPEWLQTIAPPQAGTGAQEEDERTDWLDSLLPGAEGINGKTEAPAQPEASRMVDGLDSDLDAELNADLPDWLSGLDRPEGQAAEAETLSSDVPDWLSGLGAEEPSAQPQADAAMDWLAEPAQAPQADQPAAGSDETPDWLSSLAEPTEETAASAAATAAAPAGDMPDWLKALEQPQSSTEVPDLGDDAFTIPEIAEPAADLPAAEELQTAYELPQEEQPVAEVPGVPDWLQALETEQEQPTASAEGSTDWMTAFEGTAQEAEPAESEALSADIPEWMQGLAPTEEEQAEAQSALFEAPAEAAPAAHAVDQPAVDQPVAQETPAAMPDMNDMDATMAWLESLAAKQGADEGTLLITNPDQRSEIAPDWIQQQGTEPVVDETQPAEETALAAELPDWLSELQQPADSTTEAAAQGAEEFIPGREQEPAMPEMVETSLPAAAETPTAEAAEPLAELESATLEPLAEQATAPQADLAQPDFSDMDATMAWLEALAAKQGADEGTLLITNPDQRSETPPEWVQQAAAQGAQEAQAVDDLPDATVAEPQEAQSEALAADLPDWLKDLEPSADVETEPQGVDADAGYARIYDEPQWVAEPEEIQAAGQPVIEEPAAAQEIPTAQAEAETTAAMPDMNDMDAAMAWLESLAAKQGADEATLLITNPDQRSETPPDWIQKQADQAEAVADQAEAMTEPQAQAVEETPFAVEPMTAAEHDIPEEPVAAAVQPEAEPTLEADLPDWLAQLEQPLTVELPVEAEAAWPVDSYAGDEIAAQAASMPEAVDQPETAVPTASAETSGMPDMSDMDATMAWLEALAAKQGADEGTLLITNPEQRSETPPEWVRKQTGELKLPEGFAEQEAAAEQTSAIEPAVEAELPDWMQGLGDEAASQPQSAQPAAETVEAAMQDETAAWLESLNSGSEAAPATEQQAETSETAQAGNEFMPQWLTSLEEESEAVDYGSLEETASVPVDISSAWVPEEVVAEPVRQQTAEAAPAALSLPELQSALRRGDLDRALDGYGLLIQSGQMLEETIHDLRDALYRYPVDIMIWQTLGDAYSRNNQLQEALDAYTKAEELLR